MVHQSQLGTENDLFMLFIPLTHKGRKKEEVYDLRNVYYIVMLLRHDWKSKKG